MRKLILVAMLAGSVSFHAPAASACHLEHPELWWCYFEHVGQQTDSVTCPVMASTAGSYGAVSIDGQGDIYVNGELFYDCPPYQG